jgi:hypothetical protein
MRSWAGCWKRSMPISHRPREIGDARTAVADCVERTTTAGPAADQTGIGDIAFVAAGKDAAAAPLRPRCGSSADEYMQDLSLC